MRSPDKTVAVIGKAVKQVPPLDYRWFEMASKQVPAMHFTGNWARWKDLMELGLAGPSTKKLTETQNAVLFAEERESRQHVKATQRHL